MFYYTVIWVVPQVNYTPVPTGTGVFCFPGHSFYVKTIIMAYGVTAGQSRHNALLNKIQSVGQRTVPRKLKHSAKKAFGKAKRHGKASRLKHTMFCYPRYADYFITTKHNVQSAECFIPAVTLTVPLAESILKAEFEAAHCRRNLERRIAVRKENYYGKQRDPVQNLS